MLEDLQCPLRTKYAEDLGIPGPVLEKLWEIRKHDPSDGPIPLKLGPYFRDTVKLKNFQSQSVAHEMLMPRILIGDAVGLGKTITAIAGICYHSWKNPNLKVLVVTTKSVAKQFSGEIERFSTLPCTVLLDTYKRRTSHEARMLQVDEWLAKPGPQVMVCKYSSLIGRRQSFKGPVDNNGDPVDRSGKEIVSQEVRDMVLKLRPHRENLLVVFDECHKLKNPESNTRTSMMQIQNCAHRCWGLSASLIKNGADEIYSVLSAIGLRPFRTLSEFKDRFCVYKMMHVGRGRSIPQLEGYKRMDEFKQQIRPFVYGRSQRQVKEPLPRLSTKIYELDLDEKQTKLLLTDIPSGKYELSPRVKEVSGELHLVERDASNMMTMLSVFQLVANHPCLLEAHDEKKLFTKSLSPKEEALMDLLEGDLAGEKVVVFTKYKTWINRLEYLCNNGVGNRKFLRITGNENEDQREKAKQLFQTSDDHNLIVINSAAMEGINLQQAAHMICLDLPYSLGDLLQLVGRILRIASPHSACTLHVFVSKGTIDEYVIQLLRSKKGIFEAILGSSHCSGVLEDGDKEIDLDSGIDRELSDKEFLGMLKAHVRGTSMGSILDGTKLREVEAKGESYRPVYAPKESHGRKRSLQGDIDFSGKL